MPKSMLVPAARVIETQRYAIKDKGAYVVEAVSRTPDISYGSTFQTRVQFQVGRPRSPHSLPPRSAQPCGGPRARASAPRRLCTWRRASRT